MLRLSLLSAYSDRGSAPTAPANPAVGMEQALQRDLGLTAEQSRVRQAHEAAAPVVEQQLRATLGDRFAGAWFAPAEGRLIVGVVNSRDAAAVRAAGATPVVVARSEKQLAGLKSALDRTAASADQSMSSGAASASPSCPG